jgi:hypothetical protein
MPNKIIFRNKSHVWHKGMHPKNEKTVSFIILQYQTCPINLTATKLSKNNFLNKHHTFKEYVTNIDFLARPGPNVPYEYEYWEL